MCMLMRERVLMYNISQTSDSILINVNTNGIKCRCVLLYSALGSDHVDMRHFPEFLEKRSIEILYLFPGHEYNVDCKMYDIYGNYVYGFNKNIRTFDDISIFDEKIEVKSNSATIKFNTDIECNVIVDGYIATVNTGDCSHIVVLDNLIPNKNYTIKIMINSDLKHSEYTISFKTDEDIWSIDNELVEKITNNGLINFLNEINLKTTSKNVIFDLLLLKIENPEDEKYIRNIIIYLNKIKRKDIWQKYEV